MAESWFSLSREDQVEALELAAARTGRPHLTQHNPIHCGLSDIDTNHVTLDFQRLPRAPNSFLIIKVGQGALKSTPNQGFQSCWRQNANLRQMPKHIHHQFRWITERQAQPI